MKNWGYYKDSGGIYIFSFGGEGRKNKTGFFGEHGKYCWTIVLNRWALSVDVFVTSECIHFYILCIVPQCLFREVSVMYLSI